MCGFAGFFSIQPENGAPESLLEQMGTALSHRGPDEQAIFQDDHLSFVFRRLSIVDVENGSQPIWNQDNSLFVAVNGEIYNHLELRKKLDSNTVFRTNSDSEIVLHLFEKFGVKTFSMLNGMFSIVIYDTKNQELTVARDRLGIKPLYITETSKGVLFGSELKALLLHPDSPKSLNWNDLENIGIQDKAEISSYVSNIKHFSAGTYFQTRPKGATEVVSYWDFKEKTKIPSNLSKQEIIEQYSSLIKDSLEKRLMADVPVGLFLSGGIDSSLLAALAAKKNPDLHCFTVVDKASFDSGDVDNAKKVADSLGVNFYPILFDTDSIIQDFNLKRLEKMVYLMESPRFDLEWYYKSELHKAAKKLVPELKVMLLGQGADEFAGGYSKYLGSNWDSWEDYIEFNVQPSLRQSKARTTPVPQRISSVLGIDAGNTSQVESPYKEKMALFINQLQFFNLWHEDRTSSFYGVESRVPFLDHRLVEMLGRIPETLHKDLFWNKEIVRVAMRKVMPDYPQLHPKVPFFVTDDRRALDMFAKRICQNLFEDFKTGYLDSDHLAVSDSELENLYQSSQENNNFSASNAWKLIEVMSIAIFSRFCSSPESFINEIDHKLDSAFEQANLNDRAALTLKLNQSGKLFIKPEWQMSSLINIPDGCEILNPLSESEDTTELVLMHRGELVNRIKIPEAIDWVVMLLDAMGQQSESPMSVEHWSNKVGVSPQDFVNITDNLVNAGFISRIQ